MPFYIAEAFGFRKVVGATFMIGFLVTGGDVSKADVEKYLGGLRRAQMEIDLHLERYKHYRLRAVDAYRRPGLLVAAWCVAVGWSAYLAIGIWSRSRVGPLRCCWDGAASAAVPFKGLPQRVILTPDITFKKLGRPIKRSA